MNIFLLDNSIDNCVKYHVNKHTIKMPTELAQLLSTAHRVLDNSNSDILYKKTHENHPCAIWTRESVENYNYVYELFSKLSEEYTHRYGKIHGAFSKLGKVLKNPPKNISLIPMTKFRIAISENCNCRKVISNFEDLDPVEQYRNYYRYDKSHILFWRNREIPFWVLT